MSTQPGPSRAEALWARDRTAAALGMTLQAAGAGHATVAMSVTEAMTNGHGICHGGMIFTLADTAFALACNIDDRVAVAQHCAVTFLRPARVGEMLVAVASELSRLGRTGLYDVRVIGPGGVVAEFRGQSRIVRPPAD